jgi:glutathione S-transferase
MKLYVYPMAPNPKKILIYVKEKGLDIPLSEVDILSGQNRTPEFLRKNPLGGLPVLELDDGTYLTESLAIIEYLEELHPERPMIGMNPIERARVRELERIIELGILGAIATIFQNTSLFFAKRVKQSPEAAENAKQRLASTLAIIDAKIGDRPFVTGDRPTIADCTLFAALFFGELTGTPLDPSAANVARWYESFKRRPSVQA